MNLSNRTVMLILKRIQWVIILLLGFVFVAALPFFRSAKEKRNRTQAEIQALVVACEQYRVDNGVYPTTSAFLSGNNPRKIQYITFKKSFSNSKGEFVDQWGTPFQITSDNFSLQITSAGEDKTFGTNDDIGVVHFTRP